MSPKREMTQIFSEGRRISLDLSFSRAQNSFTPCRPFFEGSCPVWAFFGAKRLKYSVDASRGSNHGLRLFNRVSGCLWCACAVCGGFGFARNTATTFDVFYWLQITNFDGLLNSAPNGPD